ncbi:glycosyltransferase [bacterium]|nr:MAG: glycosyltransferase [bacterium]
MDKKLNIIMPHLNEKEEVTATIESIYETIDIPSFEIIAIDDGSEQKTDLSRYDFVRHIENETRIGVDGSRQKGVELAETDYILVIDSHMRFKKDNWASKMINLIDSNPQTLWTTTCLGLGYGTTDINNHKGKYYGADMLFVNKDAVPDRPARDCLEPKWAKEKAGQEYDVECILGANYFFSKKWFDHIGGLKGLRDWGTSEPYLSLKSYMAGGNCKLTKDIEIGHVFRSNAPYTTYISSLVYNKIFMCKTIFPDNLTDKLLKYLPQNSNFKKAMEMIEQNAEEIRESKEYYQSIFTSSIYDYCNRFGINLP